MSMQTILFQDDFSSFPIGPLPFDREHSAMGEYHYFPQAGYQGQWYAPSPTVTSAAPTGW